MHASSPALVAFTQPQTQVMRHVGRHKVLCRADILACGPPNPYPPPRQSPSTNWTPLTRAPAAGGAPRGARRWRLLRWRMPPGLQAWAGMAHGRRAACVTPPTPTPTSPPRAPRSTSVTSLLPPGAGSSSPPTTARLVALHPTRAQVASAVRGVWKLTWECVNLEKYTRSTQGKQAPVVALLLLLLPTAHATANTGACLRRCTHHSPPAFQLCWGMSDGAHAHTSTSPHLAWST